MIFGEEIIIRIRWHGLLYYKVCARNRLFAIQLVPSIRTMYRVNEGISANATSLYPYAYLLNFV